MVNGSKFRYSSLSLGFLSPPPSLLTATTTTGPGTDADGGPGPELSSFRDGRGEIIIMQMPCCGEEESEQQMSGTASRRKRSVAYSRCAEEGRGIEYKVGFCGNEEWAPPRRGSFVFLLAPFFLSSFLPSC